MDTNSKKNEKNIALLLPSLAGGGAERVASELSQFLLAEGNKVFLFTEQKNTDYSFAGKIVLLKPVTSEVGINPQFEKLYSLAKEIKRQKKRYHIDTAISFMEYYNLANILSKEEEKVVIRVCTILSARSDLKGLYYNRLVIKCLYNRADKVIVLSKYGKIDMVKNYGIKNSKIAIIPNAVIERDYDNNISWEYGNKVILSVSRIHPVKQQGVLIDAIEEIRNVIPNVKLVLIGNDTGNYARVLKRIVKKRGLEEHVTFAGQVRNVEFYMQHSQVLTLVSIAEGFPNVVLEAMNQGMPVICTNFAGPSREILGVSLQSSYGKYGILVPRINENTKNVKYQSAVKQLSDALIEVLTNQKLAERYSEASRKRAKYYAQNRIEALWRRII